MSSTLREASKDALQVNDKTYHYYSLTLAAKELGDLTRLPKSLKVLLENLLRWQDGDSVTAEHPVAFTIFIACPAEDPCYVLRLSQLNLPLR